MATAPVQGAGGDGWQGSPGAPGPPNNLVTSAHAGRRRGTWFWTGARTGLYSRQD